MRGKTKTRIRPPAAALRLLVALVLAIGLMPLPAYAEVTAGSLVKGGIVTVSTADELVAAVQNAEDGTVIDLAADIELTSNLDVATQLTITSSNGKSLVLAGEGDGAKLGVTSTVTLKDLDIVIDADGPYVYVKTGGMAIVDGCSFKHGANAQSANFGGLYTSRSGIIRILSASWDSDFTFDVYMNLRSTLEIAPNASMSIGTIRLYGGTATTAAKLTILEDPAHPLVSATLNGADVLSSVQGEGGFSYQAASTEVVALSVSVSSGGGETVPATAVSLSATELSLEVGGTETLTATVEPEGSTDELVWASSDETVATVSDGVVTAVGAGVATITATAGEVSASCAVTVAAAPQPVDPKKAGNATQDGVDYAWSYGGNVTYAEGTGFTVTPYTAEGVTYVIDTIVVDGQAVELTDAQKAEGYTVASANSSVFATFAYTVNFNSPDGGTLSVARADGTVLESGSTVRGGEVLTIEAAPAQGYEMDGAMTLTGLTAVEGQDNAYRVDAVNGEVTPAISVAFKEVQVPTFAATVASDVQNGTVSLAASAGKELNALSEGDVVTVTAAPAEGFELSGVWYYTDDPTDRTDVAEAGGAYAFQMPAADVTVGADFAGQASAGFSVTVASDPRIVLSGGALSQSGLTGEMDPVTAAPAEGYAITGVNIWPLPQQSGISYALNPDRTYTISGTPTCDVTVSFYVSRSYAVTFVLGEGLRNANNQTGTYSVQVNEGSQLLSVYGEIHATEVGFEAPAPTIEGTGLRATKSGTGYTVSGKPTSDVTVTFGDAVLIKKGVCFELGEHMSLAPGSGALVQEVGEGEEIEPIVVVPDDGWAMDVPTAPGGITGTVRVDACLVLAGVPTETAGAPVRLSAHEAQRFSVVVDESSGGTASLEPLDGGSPALAGSFELGSKATLYAEPEEGMRLSGFEESLDGGESWSALDGDSVGRSAVAFAPTQNMRVRAVFADAGEHDLVISTAGELASFRDRVNAGEDFRYRSVSLACDIELQGEWAPIGDCTGRFGAVNPFRGTFDGGGHTVSGLSITSPEGKAAGLFGAIEDAEVRSLSVEGSINATGASMVGGIVAYAIGSSAVQGCTSYVDIDVENASYVGGVAGGFFSDLGSDNLVVSECLNYGDVSSVQASEATGTVGGIAGRCSSVEACANYGDVTGQRVGGIAGQVGIAASCANKGAVHCVVAIKINSPGAGGITAGGSASISDCYNTGDVTADVASSQAIYMPYTGGISASIRYIGPLPSLENCYNAGTVDAGERRSGDLVPTTDWEGDSYNGFTPIELSPRLTNCYASTELDGLSASMLGTAYKDVTGSVNGGLPLLAWEPGEADGTCYDVIFAAADAVTGEALEGFTVTIEGAEGSGPAFSLQGGTYAYTVSKEGYADEAGTVTVVRKDVDVKVALRPIVAVTAAVDPAGAEFSITYNGEAVEPQADGSYLLVAGREYAYSASAEGCFPREGRFTASDGLVLNVALDREDGYDGVLHGGETGDRAVSQSGKYRLADGATGRIEIGEGLEVEVVGASYDHATESFTGPVYRDLTIAVGDGSTLTLRDVRVEMASADGSGTANAVDFQGAGRLDVEGVNLLDRPDLYDSCAMVHVGPGSSVALGGTGTLYGYKHAQGAFIGANGGESNGEITFESGTWMLKGSKTGAIVGTDTVPGGAITVDGGAIYLKTVSQGAAIGSSKEGAAGDVVVNGGMVQILTDYSGAAVGDGGGRAGAGTLTVNGGSLMTVVTPNAYSSWGIDAASAGGAGVATGANVTASCGSAMVRLDTSAYAGRASVSVTVDGQPFYEGAPRYAWVTNEEKNPAGDPSTPANWLPNDGSAAGASAFAGESALYLWLPKGADHVLAVGGEEFYKATWDEASGAFALAADAEAQAAYDAERAAEVDGLIAAIPADATDAGAQAAVDAAVAAYAALTPAQRALVSNVADLLGAQAAVAAAQAAQAAAQAEAARAEAQAQGERAQAAESGLAAKAAEARAQAERAGKAEAGLVAKAAEAAAAQARAVAAQARIAALQAQVEAASAAQGLKANPMTAKAKTVKAKAGKKKTVKRSKAFTVKGAKGKVTFYKVSGNAKITVTKAGKVKVKKGLKAKKKAYKVKVLVVAAGDKDYAPAVRTVTLKVKVK